jgi:hypothetical protein
VVFYYYYYLLISTFSPTLSAASNVSYLFRRSGAPLEG